MVIWLIGISGAGKTTLGNRLKEYLDRSGKKSFIIDGDVVRDFFENDLGYTIEERVANIKRIMLAAQVLSLNGIVTVVCNISPFESLREFARRKIKDYNEIYLKRDLELSRKNDVKGMYGAHSGKTEIIGIDLKFDEPMHSDLVLNTGHESIDESLLKLISYLKTRYPGGHF